jgi:hypothetical protein
VAQIAATEDLFSALALPISSQAFEELNEVQLIVNDLNVEHAGTDTRIFPWGNIPILLQNSTSLSLVLFLKTQLSKRFGNQSVCLNLESLLGFS